jgi:uncharacterized protein
MSPVAGTEGGGEAAAWAGRPLRLVVNVAELRRRLGQRREQAIEVILPSLVVVDSRTVERPVVGSVTIESIERGVSARGSVTFEWQGDCRRCLEPVSGEIEVEIDENFQVEAPDDAELIDFDGNQIDLVPALRDAVALSLPLAPLCRDDCAGPDPERYPAVTAGQDHAETRPDPRWAALDQLDLG